jgi:glyoxylase-like metal-dependent hydrolase (beta-lactamase superfamily II)
MRGECCGMLTREQERIASMTLNDWNWSIERAVVEIDEGLWQLDLGFQGRRSIISAYLLQGDDEAALIETGPASTLVNLTAALAVLNLKAADISHALVTHIHLDHAGAAGVLARDNPGLQVHAHPFGVPHMIDPSKLVSSATRIYGDQMDTLWGEIAPIPEQQVVAFEDQSEIEVAGRTLRVLFTPGHAWHHVTLYDSVSGALFTGDVAGVRMPGMSYVCPPTPPPDFAPDAWLESVEKLRQLNARRLCLTHFGVFDDVETHLAQIEPGLNEFVATAEQVLDREAGSESLTERLHERMAADLDSDDPEVLANYELATPSYMAAMGLTRYLRKRAEATTG